MGSSAPRTVPGTYIFETFHTFVHSPLWTNVFRGEKSKRWETRRVTGLSLSLSVFSPQPPLTLHHSSPLVFLLACPKFFFQDSFEISHLKSQLRKESKQYCFYILGSFLFLKKPFLGTCLVAQWLKICLAVQNMSVWSLVKELRFHMLCSWKVCCIAIKYPAWHN